MAPLLRDRDLLLIDPRGTGRSGALACSGLSRRDPLSLDQASVDTICGAQLGTRAGLYGSAAVADDIDTVRRALGLDKLDLWGDSYGTFLMTVYAARYPQHVRSVVLDGAFPIASDPWGRDILRGVRRTIGLVCERSHRCSGRRVLTQIERLARRLRGHRVRFTAHSSLGPVRLTLSERELADVTYGGGHPEVYGLLPAAVAAALARDLAPLKRLVTVSRIGEVGDFFEPPAFFSNAAGAATSCHDYPRPYDLAAAPPRRRAQYERALAALDPAQFRPFSAGAWLSTEIDAGPKCLGWPADASAGSPLQGHRIPDVPVLVQSGDLDTDTPIEQGRRAAAQFPTRSTASSPTPATPPTCSSAAWPWRSTSSNTRRPTRNAASTPAARRPLSGARRCTPPGCPCQPCRLRRRYAERSPSRSRRWPMSRRSPPTAA
jgi:pimeloyl-ACP methyl ester carboxylesterase